MVLAMEPSDANAKRQIEILKNELKANELITTAVSLMDNQEYAQAVKYLVDARNLRPDDETIASLLNRARAKSSAPTNLEDIKSNSEHWAIYISGLEAYQSSDYREALDQWSGLLEFYPNNADLEKNIEQARQRLSVEGGNR
jgi:tetratricopeptide (TPR) repeat protein